MVVRGTIRNVGNLRAALSRMSRVEAKEFLMREIQEVDRMPLNKQVFQTEVVLDGYWMDDF